MSFYSLLLTVAGKIKLLQSTVLVLYLAEVWFVASWLEIFYYYWKCSSEHNLGDLVMGSFNMEVEITYTPNVATFLVHHSKRFLILSNLTENHQKFYIYSTSIFWLR